jgi:catechol 2,3-dioxygenase-like lactoylglutathione lyase family enzyme
LLSKICAVLLSAVCVPASLLAQAAPKRPVINGISHVVLFAANPAASKTFYVGELGFAEGTPDAAGQSRYYASPKQYVSLAPLPPDHGISRLKAVYFATADAESLRRYLAAHAIEVPPHVEHQPDGSSSFAVKDPDGHTIGFEQQGKGVHPPRATNPTSTHPTSTRMIHVGFAVHNRKAEDSFYRDLLGFRPYWHGGMKDGEEDFVSLQVPDGSDWLEYMLSVPANPSQHALGVLNHFSLGVVDINDAAKKLEEHGWHESQSEHPQDGRDGKRQLNVFDPDMTRVEFMEFQPFRKPCCSDFTASHPTP